MGRENDTVVGKVAIVTGGAKGLGKAICSILSEAGLRVFLIDYDGGAGNETAREVGAELVHADMEDEGEIAAAVAGIASTAGRIDVLVNNAAIAIEGVALHEISDETIERVIRVNLLGYIRASRVVIPHMLRQSWGRIVHIGSAQGHNPLHGWPAYVAAKGGVMAFSRQLAVEYGPFGITSNSVSPGTLQTPMLEQVLADSPLNLRDEWIQMHPVRHFGMPKDVAEMVLFLVGGSGAFINGADIRMDGGATVCQREELRD